VAFCVRIVETGECFSGDPEHSVLESMFRLGRRGIPKGCCGGACGVCKIEVLSGSYEMKAMSRCHVSPEDQSVSRVLACRIFPRSDIELRVLGVMRAAVFGQGGAVQE
jgi:ferredoxin